MPTEAERIANIERGLLETARILDGIIYHHRRLREEDAAELARQVDMNRKLTELVADIKKVFGVM